MGGSSYSSDAFTSRLKSVRDSGASYFCHTADVRSGKKAVGCHESLDPKKANKAGVKIRESRDSDTHPESLAISVLFDVTGSMGMVPGKLVDKLNKLMSGLIEKGYVKHPHVMFGAIGDATCDAVPLQVGQFEAGNEMDSTLANIYIEGGGGGQTRESYELAMYYMSKYTSMDCLDKRGKKGYLFLVGDEMPYEEVKPGEVKEFIGDAMQSALPIEKLLEELREKFEVFWIYPHEGSYWGGGDSKEVKYLRKLFGQQLISLEKAEDVCELLVMTIGAAEGYDVHDIGKDLVSVGASADSVKRASKAVTPYVKTSSVAKTGSVNGKLPTTTGVDKVERL